jgi:hypothetical protein
VTAAPDEQVMKIAMVESTTLRPFLLVSMTTGKPWAVVPP